MVPSFWKRICGSERFSYFLKSHSTKWWRQDLSWSFSELFKFFTFIKALSPLQLCLLLSHFADRETEAQEREAKVVVNSPDSRGQIHAISPWTNYLPCLSLKICLYEMSYCEKLERIDVMCLVHACHKVNAQSILLVKSMNELAQAQ